MKNLSTCNGPELEDMLQSMFKKCEEAGSKWANDKALYEDLEDRKKPLLAALGSKVEGSSAERDRQGLCNKDYTAYLDGLKETRRSFLQSQVAYDMAKARIDAIRTILSNRRAEIQRFKG